MFPSENFYPSLKQWLWSQWLLSYDRICPLNDAILLKIFRYTHTYKATKLYLIDHFNNKRIREYNWDLFHRSGPIYVNGIICYDKGLEDQVCIITICAP